MHQLRGEMFHPGVPTAKQDPRDPAHTVPGARKSTGSSPSHSVTISPTAQRSGRFAVPGAVAAQPSSPAYSTQQWCMCEVSNESPTAQHQLLGALSFPQYSPGSYKGLCNTLVHSGSVLSCSGEWPWPSPHLFICLDLQEIIIFKLLPPACAAVPVFLWAERTGSPGRDEVKLH